MSSQSPSQSFWRPPLSIDYVSIERLKPDPKNARQHTAKQIRQIAQSMESFGFNVPLLIDRDLNVIAGHGRLLACKRLGWSDVPTIRLEHLSEAQKRAFMLADNRLAEIASWDDRLLAEQLQALSSVELDFDIETIGFDMGEIDLRIESLNAKDIVTVGLAESALAALKSFARALRPAVHGSRWRCRGGRRRRAAVAPHGICSGLTGVRGRLSPNRP
jgi:ParB-like chromosome segregation protein Spo0J